MTGMRARTLMATAALLLTVGAAQAQIARPELIYYKFDEGSGNLTANHADPGVGSNPATVIDHTLDGPGVFGSTGLNGVGTNGSGVNTGWATALGTGDWTIAFWHSSVTTGSGALSYIFGDQTATSFRMFNNGVAGPNGMILRGPLADVLISGLSSADANHLAYVYDSAAGEVRGYLNGVLNVTVAQGALNINGSALSVGGYSTNTGLRDDYWMDEFQLYSRALTAPQLADAMSANFITAVPEPGTLACLGLLGVGAVAYRRVRAKLQLPKG